MEKKPAHPVVKILTAAFFITLVFGFVGYRAGAFEDAQNRMPEMNDALKERMEATPVSSSSAPSPGQIDPIKEALEGNQRMRMMVGSKSSVVFEPEDTYPFMMNPAPGVKMMMSSSKSITVMSNSKYSSPFVSQQPFMQGLAGSIVPLVEKDKRPVIKQKK